jgi:hypothetical protein
MTSNQPARHDPNCAIVRLGDIRAWCDCGKVKEAEIKAKLTKPPANTK